MSELPARANPKMQNATSEYRALRVCGIWDFGCMRSASIEDFQIQFFRPHRNNRKRPRRILFQELVQMIKRHAIDRRLDFVECANSAAHEKVVRNGASAGAG